MPLGIGYFSHGFVNVSGDRVCFFRILCHKAYRSWHTGRAKARGSWRIMGYQDRSRLFVIFRDQVLLAACASLECVGFRECFVVVS